MDRVIPLYKCNYTLNKALLDSLCSISYKCGKLALINFTYSKTKLDAEETSYLLLLTNKKISKSNLRALERGEKVNSPVEANSIYALLSHINSFDATTNEGKKHFEDAYFANESPFRTNKKIDDFEFELPPANKINPLLNRLYKFFKKSNGTSSNLIFAALSLFEIVSIAPYKKDNIILGYFYSRYFLKESYNILKQIPLAKYLYKSKDNMNQALLKSVSEGDCVHFFLYFCNLINNCLDELTKIGSKKPSSLSPKVLKMIEKMEEGKFYSSSELLELINLKSRLGLHKNYIKPALEADLLLMSNPLSPTDRTQRYARKQK